VSCEAASAAGRSLWSLDPAEKACRDQDQNPDPDPTEDVLLAGAVGSGRARTRHDGGASATNSAASGRPGPKRLELAVPAACRIQAKRTGAATRTRSRLPCPPTSPGSAARLGMFSPPAGTTRDAYYNHASVRRSPCHRPAPATWFCWRPSRCAAGSGRGMPLRAGWGSGPRSIRTGSPAWPRPPSWADVQRPLLFKVPRASHRSCRGNCFRSVERHSCKACAVLCCAAAWYIYTSTHNESSRAILARRVAPCQTARPTPRHTTSPTAGAVQAVAEEEGGNSRIGIFEVFGGRNTSQNSKQARD
jgi:hypothetical protein